MATRSISQQWMAGGVLTDVTAAKLSDPTGTYGIKRNDTDAVVVADGTVMTHTSTGIYGYSFTDVEGVAYTAYVEFVYGGETYHFEIDILARPDAGAMLASYTSLLQRVGRSVFGIRSGFSDDQVSDIEDCIRNGLQMVYRAHSWSFLRPTKDIVTEADESSYDLPGSFDGIDDNLLTWPEDEGYYAPIPIVPWSDIRRRRSESEDTGRPLYAAILATEYDPTVGSKRQIVFYPTPDDEYTLSCVMRMRWTMIDADNPYPIGGEILADAITEACLAAAEKFLDGAPGVHAEAFQAALEAAIRHDKEATSPPTLGQDGGPLDISGRRLSRAHDMDDVTFNGVTM